MYGFYIVLSIVKRFTALYQPFEKVGLFLVNMGLGTGLGT